MSNIISIEEAQAHLKDWIAKLSPGDQLIIYGQKSPGRRSAFATAFVAPPSLALPLK